MKQLRIALITLALLLVARASFYSLTDGFTVQRVEFPQVPYTPRVAPNQEQLQLLTNIFKEPFYYLAKGSQTYAFQNRDGTYILKLFKCHHWNDGAWAENLPLPEASQRWFNSLVKRRREKVSTTRTSFSLVASDLMPECGVLYIQETPAQSYDLNITIIDRAHRKHIFNAAQIGFVLQRKATLIFPTLQRWIKSGELYKAKRGIESLVALMYRRCQKGIFDSDPDIHKNAGFLESQAIFIDIGSFQSKPSLKNYQDMLYNVQKCLHPLGSWLEQHAPALKPFYQEAIEHPETCTW